MIESFTSSTIKTSPPSFSIPFEISTTTLEMTIGGASPIAHDKPHFLFFGAKISNVATYFAPSPAPRNVTATFPILSPIDHSATRNRVPGCTVPDAVCITAPLQRQSRCDS